MISICVMALMRISLASSSHSPLVHACERGRCRTRVACRPAGAKTLRCPYRHRPRIRQRQAMDVAVHAPIAAEPDPSATMQVFESAAAYAPHPHRSRQRQPPPWTVRGH
jgi:hypothetical protein